MVGDAVAFEKLATGFLFTEGPLWNRRDKYLLFSDMPGDHLRRWSEKGGIALPHPDPHRRPASNGVKNQEKT